MRAPTFRRPDLKRTVALLGVMTLVLAACTGTTTPTNAPTNAPGETGAAPTAEPKTLEIAYLSFAVANSYDAPMLAAAQAALLAHLRKLGENVAKSEH